MGFECADTQGSGVLLSLDTEGDPLDDRRSTSEQNNHEAENACEEHNHEAPNVREEHNHETQMCSPI